MQHPGMIAVVGEIRLTSGDRAYPIAYFSNQDIAPEELHQPWLRTDHWFQNEEGEWLWTISNDSFDFDLGPYFDAGALCWVDLAAAPPRLYRQSDGRLCPFINLEGVRRPQMFASGKRNFLEPPSGEPVNPFGDADESPAFAGNLEALRKSVLASLDEIAPDLELTPEDLEELERGSEDED
jgi:hypothetical protein